MQLKTLLNRVQKHRSFMYGRGRLVQGARLAIEVEVRARANSWAKCSGCGSAAPGYDTLSARRFEFVPLWGIAVFLVYAMRRVTCPELWGKGGGGALVERQASVDRHLCLVFGSVGETAVVEGGGRGFPHQLGESVPLGGDGGRVGTCASGPIWSRCDWHR